MYITKYEHCCLFEPAEGGYYYDTCSVASTEFVRFWSTKKRIVALYNELKQEEAEFGPGWEAWIASDRTACGINGPHIGDGITYYVEERVGSHESGRRNYE